VRLVADIGSNNRRVPRVARLANASQSASQADSGNSGTRARSAPAESLHSNARRPQNNPDSPDVRPPPQFYPLRCQARGGPEGLDWHPDAPCCQQGFSSTI